MLHISVSQSPRRTSAGNWPWLFTVSKCCSRLNGLLLIAPTASGWKVRKKRRLFTGNRLRLQHKAFLNQFFMRILDTGNCLLGIAPGDQVFEALLQR